MKYNKNFLDKVIIRVDFAQEISEINKSLPELVTTTALKVFEIPEPQLKQGTEFTIGPKKMAMTEVSHREWYYHGKDRDKHLCITPKFMFIYYDKYNDEFKFAKDDFIQILNALYQAYSTLEIQRLGIRYIDKIELDESNATSWEQYIDKKLLSIFDIADDKSKISRAFHNLEMNYGDMNVKFQYGMHNPDYPAPIRKKIFIIDTDIYLDSLQSKSDIEANLVKFHSAIVKYFEQSITDKLREVMNG